MSGEVLDTAARPRRQDGTRVRRVGGRVVLILESGGLELNQTAESVWMLCTGTASVADIVKQITEEYDADEEDIRADVVELLEELESLGALEIVAPA
ncbi:PqqD family protein [[Actinomadura] parvosata]|uniref:PqqD family protein n=1 Tax=[Actinomadura] parvosata TaxID=1955412 RepID=UPI0016473B8D|nr:PqqD family protein [Nonomuraea sp. ATCC 55076]